MYQATVQGHVQVRELPCKKCNSSDAVVYYYKDNKAYCMSCNYTFLDYDTHDKYLSSFNGQHIPEKKETSVVQYQPDPNKVTTGFFPISKRGLTKETCEKYGVRVDIDNSTGEIQRVRFPFYNSDGEQINTQFKWYLPDGKKKFSWENPMQDDTLLFGQKAFQSGWKFVTITEGQEDAMAVNQMLGSHAPSVSIYNGAKALKKNLANSKVYDWLNSFDKIVVCFDADEPGQEAVKEISEMFSPEKVYVMKMRYKDANEYLLKGKKEEFTKDWYSAKQMILEGVKNGEELRDYIFEPAKVESVPFPWKALDEITKGIRMGELTTITAGSGMGKTLIMSEIISHLLESTTHPIGCLFLENSEAKTAQDIVSVAMSYPLRFALQNQQSLEDAIHYYNLEHGEGAFERDREEAYKKTLGSKRIWTIGDKDFACNNIEKVISRVRYMAKVLGCKYIFLDHISIIVSSQEGGDERKALDEIATKLRMLVHDLNIHLFMVSHSKRPNGKSHEEGGQTSLSELRGTAGIGQLSDTVLGLERDGQNKDEEKRSITLIRVLKNRFAGITGPSCYLKFNKKTYRLHEIPNPDQPIEPEEVEKKDYKDLDLSSFEGIK